MSTYQATVVPQQNSQVEFTHEQTVRNDFVGVRDAVVTAGTTGEIAPATLKLGTRFPSRTLFVNPPPAVGRIETGEPRNVTLNVSQATFRANPPESGEVEDGWPTSASEQVGADGGVANYTTKPLVYTPQYRSYDGEPDNITLELSHALSRYAGGETVNLTEAPLLARGDRVTLFLVKGNLSESGVESVTLEPTAVSSVSQRVRVSNFTVTIPTSLTAAQFERLTNETRVSNPENVSFSDNGSRVDVTFEDNRSLGVGVVSLGRHEASRTAAAVEFTSVEASVTQGESARVVVRVRDQYGNALPNADVTANMSDDGRDGKRLVTDGTGQAAFEFDTGGLNGSVNVNVTVNESGFDVTNQLTSDDFGQSAAENATVKITVNSLMGNQSNPNQSNPSQPNPPLPEGDIAFDDTDGDGEYDGGEAYTASELIDGFDNSSVDLVIARNESSLNSGENQLQISANSITSRRDIKTDDAKLSLTASGGDIDISSGKTLDSDESQIDLTASSGAIRFNGSTLKADEAQIQLDSEAIFGTGANVQSGQLRLTASRGDIDISGESTLDSGESQMQFTASSGAVRFNESTLKADEAQIQLDGEGIYGTDADVLSRGSKIRMNGGTSNVVLTDTLVDSSGGKTDISTDATLRITNATVRSGESKTSLFGGDIFGDDLNVTTDESALTITATEGGNIRTEGGAFRTNGGKFEMETSGDVCLDPSSNRSSIRAGDGKAIISTANASYLHNLFVSASKGLEYISGEGDGNGDYFAGVKPTGDGLRNGPEKGEGNEDWDQIGNSTDCGI